MFGHRLFSAGSDSIFGIIEVKIIKHVKPLNVQTCLYRTNGKISVSNVPKWQRLYRQKQRGLLTYVM